jgi:hypothetical protein
MVLLCGSVDQALGTRCRPSIGSHHDGSAQLCRCAAPGRRLEDAGDACSTPEKLGVFRTRSARSLGGTCVA